jgi:lipopolysaccharide biosynthesis protein
VLPRLIAFYLPQFHPTPENDLWWGKGFTEWVNVAKAQPLFIGHYQPHLPADLGFYDLRLAETRQAQANLAGQYGISGFCYYHYWFNNKRLLGRVLDEVLVSGKPDFPFCLCWANEDWTRTWDGRSSDILIEQQYSLEDDRQHIDWLVRVFQDPRYIRIEGRPLFLVYRAGMLPDALRTTTVWREQARNQGIGELYLCRVESFAEEHSDPVQLGFDAAVEFQPDWSNLGPALRSTIVWKVLQKFGLTNQAYRKNGIYQYGSIRERMAKRQQPTYKRLPCVTPAWDNSPRRKTNAIILHDSTPKKYQDWLMAAIIQATSLPENERIVFINAWNEWAEGNHLEPDLKYGHAYLKATRQAIENGT